MNFSFRIIFGFLALLHISQVAAVELPSFADLVEEQGVKVVNISTKTMIDQPNNIPVPEDDPFYDFFRRFAPPEGAQRESRSLGSGFIISEDGYILTNSHVVAATDDITVKLNDKREFMAKLIGVDKRTDVAVIKIEASGLPFVSIGDPDKLRVGDWVLAIGSPFGFESTVTAGIVSAKGRSLPQENYVPFIQTDVAINPGNSGGPLFNLDGKVVGINSQIYSRSGGSIGLSFAIPVSVANNVVKQLKNNGKVQRGWLGVGIQDIDKKLAEALDLPGPQGALVTAVMPDSPAEKGDIAPGDVIVRFDSQSILDSDDLPHIVGLITPGKKVKVELFREGIRKHLSVEVGALDRSEQDLEIDSDGSDRLGLIIEELNEGELRSLRLRGGIRVTRVSGGSAAEIAGLIPGDLVVQVGYSRIDDIEQYQQVIASLPKGTPIPISFYRQGQAIFRTIQLND